MKACVPLLNVKSAEDSINFYRDKLGFTVQQKSEAGGNIVFAFLSRDEVALMINVSQERATRPPRENPKSYDDVVLYFSVEDLHHLHDQLVRAGVKPSPIEHQDYGRDEFTLRDPDGYELAFSSASNK